MSLSITGKSLRWLVLPLLCASLLHAQSSVVDANHYDAFWLWAGVAPQPPLNRARTVYLLDAEVRPGHAGVISQRPSLPHVRRADVWLVVRVETLDWSPEVYGQVLTDLALWMQAGNNIKGVQIDFDARTHHLETYAVFLKGLRDHLPPNCKLGITGLLDWSSQGDPRGLDALAAAVDEVVLQIYQGRHVIPGYEQYLARLDRLKIPFRIGLLQGGDWRPPANLTSNPYFRGYVVFLRNPVSMCKGECSEIDPGTRIVPPMTSHIVSTPSSIRLPVSENPTKAAWAGPAAQC